MMKDIRSALTRTQPTLLQDAIGAAALMVMLVVGLHLPAMI